MNAERGGEHMRKHKFAISLAALMLCAFAGVMALAGAAAESEPLTGADTYVGSFEGYALSVNAERGFFWLERNGYTWRSNPEDCESDKKARDLWKGKVKCQLVIEYTNKGGKMNDQLNSSTHCATKGGLSMFEAPDGLLIHYYFPLIGVDIPLHIRIGDGYFDAEIILDEIRYENDNAILTDIQILPMFGAGRKTDTGYILVPESSGALITLNNGKKNTAGYKATVYGVDASIESAVNSLRTTSAILPVFGINRGDSGFLAVIDKGDAHSTVYANTSDNVTSYNHAFPGFTIRSFDQFALTGTSGVDRYIQVVEKGDIRLERIRVRYYLMERVADYNAMARIYREHLTGVLGTATASEEHDLYLTLYGLVDKNEPVMGVPVWRLKRLTTYEQALEITRRFGAEKPLIKYVQADEASAKMQPPDANARDKRLGGKAEWDKLNAQADVFVELDAVNARSSALDVLNMGKLARNIMGMPSYRYQYNVASGQKIESSRWTVYKARESEDILASAAREFLASGNAIFLDELGEGLYSDFDDGGAGRQYYADAYARALTPFAMQGARMLVELGNAYTYPYAAYIADMETSAALSRLTDYGVPFAQLALNGLKSYSVPPLNMAGNMRTAYMKAVETGAALSFAFIYADTTTLNKTMLDSLYGVNYALWIDQCCELFEEYKSITSQLGRLIARHDTLMDGNVLVTYQNGATAYFNYQNEPAEYAGVAIPARAIYVVKGGDGQ